IERGGQKRAQAPAGWGGEASRVGDGSFVAERQAKDRLNAVDRERNSVSPGGSLEALAEPSPIFGGPPERGAIVARQLFARRLGRGQHDRVAIERSAVQDLSRGNNIHDLGASGDDAQRKAGGDGFAEGGQVRDHSVALLRAAQRHAKPGDDFIEDQQRAGVAGGFTQGFGRYGGGGEGFARAQERVAGGGGGIPPGERLRARGGG